MKRPLQLPLAIALALGGTNALALGLGPVHVNSKLNQPLDAEIPVLQGGAGEAEGLLVNLAAAEDFDRIGLNRSRLNVPLEFSLGKNARGEPIIRVTSKEPVRDSFLDFLVEANWPKGRLLREYTILLDPPVMAPATARTATNQPDAGVARHGHVEQAREAGRETPGGSGSGRATRQHAEAGPGCGRGQGDRWAVRSGRSRPDPVRSRTLGRRRPQRQPDDAGVVEEQSERVLQGQYQRAEARCDPAHSVGRRGQGDRFGDRGGRGKCSRRSRTGAVARASPTLVADAGSKPAAAAAAAAPKKATTASTTPAKSSSERLELVPPKAGKDSIAMADRPVAAPAAQRRPS